MYGKSRVNYSWRIAKWLETNIFTSMPKHDVKINVIVDSRNSVLCGQVSPMSITQTGIGVKKQTGGNKARDELQLYLMEHETGVTIRI